MSPSLFKPDTADPPRDTNPPTDASVPIDRNRRRRADEPASLSVIGPGMEIVGEVRGRGDAQIEGRIEGRLDFDGQVRVSSCGRIEGDLVVDRLVVAGEVEGTISARDSAELLEGCRVDADVTSPKITLAAGGVLNGRLDMSKPGEAAARKGPGKPGAKETTDGADEAPRRAEGAA